MVSRAALIQRSDPSELNTTSLSFAAVERSSEGRPSTSTHGSEELEDHEGYSKHTEVMARDGEGFRGVRTLRHQAHNQRCIIVLMRYVDLARAETSWETTQPAHDGGDFSAYLKGSGEPR